MKIGEGIVRKQIKCGKSKIEERKGDGYRIDGGKDETK